MSGGRLDTAVLRALAALVVDGSLASTSLDLASRPLGIQVHPRTVALLRRLEQAGADAQVLALVLRELAGELEASRPEAGVVCVASGPRPVAGIRDTAVVMEELFSRADQHLLVVGYAVHQGERVLRTLAERMDAEPSLEVVLCLDVARQAGDTTSSEDVLARWSQRFRQEQWPGARMPALYFDPRALLPPGGDRASLHAKCVVADRRIALVTSANLTVAAQERNIEFGVLVEDSACAREVASHFEALIREGHLRRLPL